MYPRSGVSGARVGFIGNHRIQLNSSGQFDNVYALKIGDDTCVADGIRQLVYQGDHSRIICDLGNEEGGYYNVSSWLLTGYSKKRESMLVSSLVNKGVSYEYIINPVVQSISTHSGSGAGNRILIEGSGFSEDSTKL